MQIPDGHSWEVEFRCAQSSEYPTLMVSSVNLQSTPGVAYNLGHSRTPASPSLDGSFTLAIFDQETAPLPFNVAGWQVEAALEAIEGIHDVSVDWSNNPLTGQTFAITFISPAGDYPLLGVNGTGLVGPGAAIQALPFIDGSQGLFMHPIPGDFLQLNVSLPVVQVVSNGYLASCGAGTALHGDECAYQYSEALTPVVTGVSTSQAVPGAQLVITGTGFGDAAEENTVSLGEANCEVTAASATQITCTIGDGAAGEFPVVVIVKQGGAGLARVAAGVPLLTYATVVDSVEPRVGGICGGTVITMTGTGFFRGAGANVVTFTADGYSTPCDVINATNVWLMCRTRTLPNRCPLSVAASLPNGGHGHGRLLPAAAVAHATAGAGAGAGAAVPESRMVDDVRLQLLGAAMPRSRDLLDSADGTAEDVDAQDADSGSSSSDEDLPEPLVYRVSVNEVDVTLPASAPSARRLSPAPVTFEYNVAMTPVVSALTPAVASVARSTLVTLRVDNVPAGHDHAHTSVWFGEQLCALQVCEPAADEPTSMHIECRLLRTAPPAAGVPQAPLVPIVQIVNLGYAHPNNHALDRRLFVSRVTPDVGSLYGGNELTITGRGFGTDPDFLSVTLYDPEEPDVSIVACTVLHLTNTEIVCVLDLCTDGDMRHLAQDTNAVVEVVAHSFSGHDTKGFAAPCNVAGSSPCGYRFTAAATPSLDSVTVSDPATNTGTLVLTGTQLLHPLQVSIGDVPCPVTLHLPPNRVECALPEHGADVMLIMVVVQDLGMASGEFTHTFPLAVTGALSHTSGSIAGGLAVTLSGRGFKSSANHTSVTFGSSAATFVSASTTSLVVLTPPNSGAATAPVTVPVTVTVAYQPQGMRLPNWRSDPSHPMGETHRMLARLTGRAPHVDAAVAAGRMGQHRHLVVSTPAATSASVTLTAAFTFSTVVTSRITSVSPSTGFAGTSVVITGSSLGATQAGSSVAIGGAPCAVTSWSATSITCTVGNAAAGRQVVMVTVEGRGLAAPTSGTTPITFTAQLEATARAPASGGYGGGLPLTLTGRGFAPLAAAATSVTVCGRTCAVTAATYGSLTCTTPALATPEALATFGQVRPAVLSPGSSAGLFGTGRSSAYYALAFDGNIETTMKASSCVAGGTCCTVGMDLGPASLARVTSVRAYPNFQKSSALAGGMFQGSTDGSTYVTLATITGRVQEGWTTVDVTNAAEFRYLRFVGASAGLCEVNEVQFVGYTFPAWLDGACPVNVTVGPLSGSQTLATATAPSVVLASPFQYNVAETVQVTGVSPSEGSSLGGTLLTITGAGFGSVVDDVAVVVNGVPCDVQSVADAEVTCVTGARPPPPDISRLSFSLSVTGAGAALRQASSTPLFRYLDRWSALTTWLNQEPPVEGDFVVIPDGQTVLLDVSPPELLMLLIQGSLVFDRKDLALDATYILIQGGSLEVGTEEQPFTHNAVITLHGDRYRTIGLPTVGNKMLAAINRNEVDDHSSGGHVTHASSTAAVVYGSISLHGQPRIRSWTKLEESVMPGDDVVTTSEDVDFRVGDHLVLTASEMGAGLTQTEEVVVAEVFNARSFRLTEPVQYPHRVQYYNHPGFAQVDMRVEVGLLTRNVVVQGDEGSTRQLYGVHMVSMHGSGLKVSGVEIRRCGQAFVLGRYCSHFHMAGRKEDAYIKDNAIHHSFQRAVTIHATHHSLVQNNVAYNVRGHTYFVEVRRCAGAGDVAPGLGWAESGAPQHAHDVVDAGSCVSRACDSCLCVCVYVCVVCVSAGRQRVRQRD